MPMSPRTLLLRYLPLFVLVVINVLFLTMLDSLFAIKKRALIIDSKDKHDVLLEQIRPLKEPLDAIRDRHPANTSTDLMAYREEAKAYLDQHAESFLETGEHPWFRVVLDPYQEDAGMTYAAPEKLKRWNTFSNCLFSQSFEAPAAFPSLQLTAYFATPRGWESIQAMVVRYRVYAVLFVMMTCLAYFWLERMVLRPLRRVGQAIEGMIQPGKISLIAEPRHDIEIASNRLARIQREVYFGLMVENLVNRLHRLSDDRQALESFLEECTQAISAVYDFQPVEVFWADSDEKRLFPLPADSKAQAGHSIPWMEDGVIRQEDAGGMLIPLRSGGSLVGALRCHPGELLEEFPEECQAMALEIQKQCENGMARTLTRSRALTEERNRFGINLATNMGHDLTNIIASGKWDLDTIQRAIGLGIVTLDQQRGSFFEEAVHGLRNNLYFLQEMVNIYRSFGYIRRPRFEPIDMVALLNEISHLFQLSTSQKLQVEVDAPEDFTLWVEPRLMRMALFNLMSNAAQAMQRSESNARHGEIRLLVKRLDEAHVSILVQDNGPGIRDPEGNLLSNAEINRIFQSGYTTKDGASGGGLGLAWVKSIVRDFHHGSLSARNLEEGGACIEITLPMQMPVEADHAPAEESAPSQSHFSS